MQAANAVACSLRATSNPLEFQTRQSGTQTDVRRSCRQRRQQRQRQRQRQVQQQQQQQRFRLNLKSRCVASPRVPVELSTWRWHCLSPLPISSPPSPPLLVGKMSKVCEQNGNIHTNTLCVIWLESSWKKKAAATCYRALE